MKHSGVIGRWMRKSLSFIAALLVIVAVVLAFTVRAYYYRSIATMLDSRDSNLVATYFNIFSGTTDESFAEASRDFIENFDDKSKMCVWIINKHGNVIATSDGFDVPQETFMPDYAAAVESETGRGDWTGRLETGEKVMAMTVLLSPADGEGSAAVRYLISLREVDAQTLRVIMLIAIVSLIAIFLCIFPGTVFISNITRAIKNITAASKKIAAGNMEMKLTPYPHDDEIGELQKTISNMLVEINAADTMKNDFISTISHELRTPLTAIKGWGETIQQVGESDAALTKRGMEVIIGESTRLTGMVEELLDFSRMQSGRMSLRTERIDVLAELDETVFTFKERAMREGKELLYNSPNIPAPMDGDPDRIMQVFVNVIDNAIKYTKQGGKILIQAEIPRPESLEITVSDTGCGISESDLPRVKEKFYKADTSVRGSGIGLAVADEIVRLHGGELVINSIFGKGTTVTIKLPVEQVTLTEERGTKLEQ